jgi:hypothetical protein
MAARKIKDIAVKTGEYQDNNGQTKGRYQNIGALMKNEDGSVFILLQRWFNPAGINSDRETILLSCFDLREQGEQQSSGGGGGQSARPGSNRQQSGAPAMDDDIPFKAW